MDSDDEGTLEILEDALIDKKKKCEEERLKLR